jgi:hypothetical protein
MCAQTADVSPVIMLTTNIIASWLQDAIGSKADIKSKYAVSID